MDAQYFLPLVRELGFELSSGPGLESLAMVIHGECDFRQPILRALPGVRPCLLPGLFAGSGPSNVLDPWPPRKKIPGYGKNN